MPIDRDNRWMPPSPHREKVIEELQKGRMVLVEQGHGLPPLVRHEDGGVLELPNLRWNGGRWSSERRGDGVARQTSYQDVCGSSFETFDILKGELPLSEQGVRRLFELQSDILYMNERMDRRHRRYEEFANRLAELAEAVKRVRPSDPLVAKEALDEVRRAVEGGGPHDEAERARLLELSERARLVAQSQEDTMAERKDLAIKALLAFNDIRGARNWDEAIDGLSSQKADGEAED